MDYLEAWRERLQRAERHRGREAERLRAKAVELAQLLGKQFGVRRVYLFGSLARGDLREGSDIDLAVEGLAPRVYFQALAMLHEASRGLPIDLIPLEDTDIRDAVIEEGKVKRSWGDSPGSRPRSPMS